LFNFDYKKLRFHKIHGIKQSYDGAEVGGDIGYIS